MVQGRISNLLLALRRILHYHTITDILEQNSRQSLQQYCSTSAIYSFAFNHRKNTLIFRTGTVWSTRWLQYRWFSTATRTAAIPQSTARVQPSATVTTTNPAWTTSTTRNDAATTRRNAIPARCYPRAT